jgi:hypothetical protein
LIYERRKEMNLEESKKGAIKVADFMLEHKDQIKCYSTLASNDYYLSLGTQDFEIRLIIDKTTPRIFTFILLDHKDKMFLDYGTSRGGLGSDKAEQFEKLLSRFKSYGSL